jgi:hypothetical protein
MTALEFFAVENAVRAAVTAIIERGEPVHQAVAAAAVRLLEGRETESAHFAERPSERTSRENAVAMGIMADFHARGRGRCGAASAAKRLAADPGDPLECEKLQQRFRRLWREAKKNEQCSVVNEPAD